jgi:hypothetical protein
MREILKSPFPWFSFLRSLGYDKVVGMTTEQRFWAKVQKTVTCWLWTASTRDKGYGAFAYHRDGKFIQDRAHRYSWEIHKGPIPEGQWVLHNCPGGDNPACVNPAHLFLGNAQINVTDMINKGRRVLARDKVNGKYPRGVNHHNARLTDEEIATIRQHRSEGWSFGKISKEHGIAIGYAFRVVNGTARKVVTR